MGRSADTPDRDRLQPAPPAEEGSDMPHGMGVSSEHDQGQVQEVDSREQE